MSDLTETTAPKESRGRFFEDMELGDVYRSRLGRTIEQTDNTWFTLLTCNTNQVHFNSEFAASTEFGLPLVNSCLTLSIVVGLSVADTSENAMANLGWDSISMPKPVFAGDTLWAESEVISKRESASRPHQGIIGIRTRGVNQRGETVVEFLRTFMMYRRSAPQAASHFPEPVSGWTAQA
jgi:itaconyl-CoA hydratase